MKALALGFALALVAAPAAAQERGELDYRLGALGYDALVSGDYATAEKQLRNADPMIADDPARLINLGQVLARTGRLAEAAELFRRAKALEDGEVVLANGEAIGSREAARRALRSLPDVRYSSR